MLNRLWNTSWSLSVVTVLIGLCGLFSVAAVFLDPRVLVGAPIWFKPLKFGVSVVIYTTSLLWILSHVTRWRRTARLMAFIVAANLTFDLAWIMIQTGRGVRSHFNISTAFDAKFYALVGASINLVMVMNLVAVVLVLLERLSNKTFTAALTFGLLASVVGGFSAIPMITQTTAAQRAQDDSGVRREVAGGHSFGVEEGGSGFPLLGWSTDGGDGRVPHFVGLHGLQLIPLIGVWIERRYRDRFSDLRRAGMVAVIGLAYIGITLLLLWQALRGQSVIAPDVLTIGAFAGLLGATGLVLLGMFRWPSSPQDTTLPVPT